MMLMILLMYSLFSALGLNNFMLHDFLTNVYRLPQLPLRIFEGG